MNILKLSKNLKEFTLDEIEMLAECECKTDLENLMEQNLLQFDGKIYKYYPDEKILFFELNQKPVVKTGEKILFKDIMPEYLQSRKLTKNTLKGYKSQLKFNILPFFGEKFLDEITLTMLNDFMNFLKTRYKPKTVWNGVTLTGSILKWAFEEGLIEHNPYLGVKNTMPRKKGAAK
jgi:hypothetical protein